VGESRANHRLGRAIPLRRNDWKTQKAERDVVTEAAASAGLRDVKHIGPYMPVLIQACEEGQLAYEYRHGVTAHGAFTFLLDRILREQGSDLSFEQFVKHLTAKLGGLGYDQTPCLIGPRKLLKQRIPFPRRPR
jgi:hypothetical protein